MKALLAPALFLAIATPATAAEPPVAELTARHIMRASKTLIDTQPLSSQELDVAVRLMEQAAALVPDNAEVWRTFLKMADLAEREDLQEAALLHLVQLDPADDVVRLRRVNLAIDRYQTLEERQAAFDRLLTGPLRARLGDAVASRVAFDYAMLLDRAGDDAGFARWMAEAVALDPSNRPAAATAAGFFRMNARDPFAEAELFATLVMADPTSVESQTAFAELLLRHGAYEGADRFYDLAARTSRAFDQPVAPGLLADRAVAQWGHGDAAGALKTVQDRKREVNELFRLNVRRNNPEVTPLEAARMEAPVAVTLATVRAAIHERAGDDQADEALRTALVSYEGMINTQRQQSGVEPETVATTCLEAAFAALWLGADINRAAAYLKAATEFLNGPLSDNARARFEGWVAFRSGDLTRAVETLAPLAADDSAANLGLALALEAQGRRREAARALYGITQQAPGTLMAVWSAEKLADLLGQRIPASETARRLEELVDAIPHVIDRLPEEPTLAVSMRLLPVKPVFDSYEPIIVNLEITNNAPFPLAIDPRGPITPQVAIITSVQMAREPKMDTLRPMIIDIDRRLSLDAREQIIIPVDVRDGQLGQVLNRAPMRGATIKVRAVTSFHLPRGTAILPGVLGSEVFSPAIRINGVRLGAQWISDSIAAVVEPDSSQDVRTAGLLSHLVYVVTRAREEAPLSALEQFGNPRLIVEEAALAVAESFSKMDPISRSWLLGSVTRSPGMDPVYVTAQQDPNQLVQLSYLLYCLRGVDDPMIDAASRSDDPLIRDVGAMMKARIAAITGQSAK